MNKISEITRRDIQDFIILNKINWSGRVNEPDFLARLFDLEKIASYDIRFKTFYGDVYQHRINNYDWDDDWIFTDDRVNLLRCSDQDFLRFLCETIHPAVRSDYEESLILLNEYNRNLKNDGYQIVEKEKISGHSVYIGRHIFDNTQIIKKDDILNKLSSEYIMQQISAMELAIDKSPYIAIGLAKELIETVLKNILSESGQIINDDWNIPQLLKETSKVLNLVPKDISEEKKGADKIKQILGSLGSIISGIAELRNDYGSGHGRNVSFKGLQTRHAKLAVGSASTLAIFLLETWGMKKGKNV